MPSRTDLRAKLTVKGLSNYNGSAGNSASYMLPFGGPGAALYRTGGIIFPYTPNITVSHQVDYSMYDVVHTNYQQNAYNSTRNPAIQVTGSFVSQTPEEAQYTVGVMHFLRVVSKMHFGARDADRGTPPPVLNFSAYGAYNFSNIPVVVGSFDFVYEDGVDYVEVVTAGETVQIPSMMTISISLMPQYSPGKVTGQFNLNEFASGAIYKNGFI